MSIIDTNETGLLSHCQRNYCCQQNQYYINQKSLLVNTLDISPRVIIYNKPLKLDSIYETIVSVTNRGLHSRRLLYTTDSEDISIKIHPNCLTNNILSSNQSVQLTICLEPKTKLNINRRRHIFIESQHPNIIFSLPIIIITKNDNTPSLPAMIKFPSTCMKTFAFYEMILYNKDTKKLSFTFKCNNTHLTAMLPGFSIPKRHYIKILLKLSCKEMNEVRNVMKLKFGSDSYEIPFIHTPIEWKLFLDTLLIQFDTLKFNRTETKSFRICNESQRSINFQLDVMPEEVMLNDNDNEKECCASENRRSKTSIPRNSTVSTASYKNDYHNETCCNEHKSLDNFSFRHFQVEPHCGTIAPNTSFLIQVTFKPIMHNDFDTQDLPPFPVSASLLLLAQDEPYRSQQRNVVIIKGYINGPDIEIIPKCIDFRTVYFGEEHCAEIRINNIDGLSDCHVDFHDFVSHDDSNVLVTPQEGLDLKCCQSGLFHLQFFAKIVGTFLVKLEFKVRSGNIFSVMVRGYSQPVRVKCFPDVLDLGIVPVCVPQVKLVLLINPLSVPIAVQCTVHEDGIETPLVLNVVNTNEHLPINIKDPVYQLAQCYLEEESQLEENCIPLEIEKPKAISEDAIEYADTESSLMSYKSMVLDDASSYSTEFQEQVLDHIPAMASTMLNYLKKIKIFDKSQIEKTVIEETLNSLLKIGYFSEMDKYKNYCNMDWNALPTDPKELYCNNEVIYLNPNTGKVIGVVIIPNIIGRQNKYLELRVCPIIPPNNETDLGPNLEEIVDSDFLISKLWIEYNCSVPEIMWDSVIDMQEPLYAGQLYEFEMIFENCSKIGGFFYYDAIPNNEFGIMRFLNDRWKYFVEPESVVRVPCAVEFKKHGFITLMGLIKFVGVNAGFPFHIKSEILPPQVNISPQQIVHKIPVLHAENFYVYIENATPTTTWISLKLKDDSYMSVYPKGAQLAPTGQTIYVTLMMFFKDPGTYKNTLQIIMQYETVQNIPITLHVVGMPIFFEPEILNQTLHIGNCILCTTEDDYLDHSKTTDCKVIRVVNKGERYYRITVTKTKTSEKPTCPITPIKAKVNVNPSNLVLKPMSANIIVISANACEQCFIHNEFRIDLTDLSEPRRKQSFRLVMRGQFVFPQLLWNHREVVMNYCRTHKYKEQSQWEILKLSNLVDNFVDFVLLKITGPFLLKANFEDRLVKSLEFSMLPSETKEFFIMLDKDAIRNRLDIHYEGCISCVANDRVQKSVHLKVNIYVPTLTIKQNNVTLFTKNVEGGTHIVLHNRGPVQAAYKWKKLQEEWRYISEEENSQQLVDIILSDILHTLDVNFIAFENDSEINMTKRYQKSRCYIHKLNDPINIRNLIDDIIEDLDLCHKRYKFDWPISPAKPKEKAKLLNATTKELKGNLINDIRLRIDEPTNDEENQMKEFDQNHHNKDFSVDESTNENQTLYLQQNLPDDPSSAEDQSCVFHTVDCLFDNLKLYDSFTISQPSSESCQPQRSVYFFEKSGIVENQQWKICSLHIPAIRKGYELRASFQLDVEGGNTQEFHITMVNLDKTLKLSKDNIYLGLKPWYEHFKETIVAENLTIYPINLSIYHIPKPFVKFPKLAAGYVNVINKDLITLAALETTHLKVEGTMGFGEEFLREIRLIINDSEEMIIRLRGQGVMPMLALSDDNLPFVEQDTQETLDDYRSLRKCYYYEIFKTITENDDENSNPKIEEHKLKDISSIDSETNSSFSSMSSKTKSRMEDRYLHSLLETYVCVNMTNDELPNSSILEQILATEKLLNQLHSNTETCSQLNMIYREYKHLKCDLILKHFTIQSLPFQLKARIFDMEELALNQYRKFVIHLCFNGPGKLIAAIRTAIKIPGLILQFDAPENTTDQSFIYYRSDCKKVPIADNPYRNISERQLDAEIDPKVKHAHSYDINICSQHQRNVAGKDRKWLRTTYNSLNKSIYVERKHHFTHCKISSNCRNSFSDTKFNIVMLMRPEKRYYKHGQRIEDYLFVDLHMGPTLPILLRGIVVDTKLVRNKLSSAS